MVSVSTNLFEFNSSQASDQEPQLIANSKSAIGSSSENAGETLLSYIRTHLKDCSSFDFCVAFITEGGLQTLVQVLNELPKNVRGRILTSTYLDFNSPATYKKLLGYTNIEVRIFTGNLHAKGYIFDKDNTCTAIIGSSNLTAKALTCNKEWNVLYKTYGKSEYINSIKREFHSLWEDEATVPLTSEWIEDYAIIRTPPIKNPSYPDHRTSNGQTTKPILPNKMQQRALEALSIIHKTNQPRALLVSATGTGKTYLSAFDVLNYRPRRILFLAHRQRILDASRLSYEKVLGTCYSYSTYKVGQDLSNASCVFAMCSSVAPHLNDFNPGDFDYIVIDEAHRSGSSTYQKIMDFFKPSFFFGMTATPNRTDGFNVYELFNHVIAYQITLQDALAEEMLAPFHYFGIHDLSVDDKAIDDPSSFSKLTSDERVRHITEKIEEYSIDEDNRRGLIFCNRKDEARTLSLKFNKLGYKTCALCGDDSEDARNDAIRRLENGELEYIFSVDILNEGIDIPSINQIIMLRRTDSSIIFVQQLGRGLRLSPEKEYTLVLDFIGNYQTNFLVPVALTGDKTYNKDRLRRLVQEGDSVIPGCSTISFDRISESRIYRAIDGGKFTSTRFLKTEYLELKQQLGKIPSLLDFDRNGSIDPLLIFKSSYGSYHAFLCKADPDYKVRFSDRKCTVLKFISQKLAAGKRFEDLYLLLKLVEMQHADYKQIREKAILEFHKQVREGTLKSAGAVLGGNFSSVKNLYPLTICDEYGYRLTSNFAEDLCDPEFKNQILELLEFGISRNQTYYSDCYADTNFVLYQKYSYEEVCRLLNWEKNISGINIGGYKYDESTNTFPVFINYDKSPDISETTQYNDRFLSNDRLIALSKSGRTLNSEDMLRLQHYQENGIKPYLFMRKNKDDGTSKDFYFLGDMYPTGKFIPVKLAGEKNAVEIEYKLRNPVPQDIYDFMLSDLSMS